MNWRFPKRRGKPHIYRKHGRWNAVISPLDLDQCQSLPVERYWMARDWIRKQELKELRS